MIVLPVPPSLNDLYGINKSGHRFKKKAHTDYISQVQKELILKSIKPTDKYIRMDVKWFRSKKVGDIDNLFKTLFDSMAVPTTVVKRKRIKTSIYGVYENDNQIDELHVYRYLDRDNPRIEISYQILDEKD